MQNIKKFLRKLLHFTDVAIVNFHFNQRERTFHLFVKPWKNGCCCPDCGQRGKIVRTLKNRQWIDVPVGRWKVILNYAPREIKCRTHGRSQEVIPWAAPNARVTHRFEYLMLRYASVMTQKQAAELLRVPASTFSDILHRTIKQLRKGRKIRGLKRIGIDETSYRKGHKYITVVYDLDRSCVVWIGKGKGRATIDRFFEDALSQYQRDQIKIATCDMSEAYLGAIKHHCKNAELVLDRFHVMKALNDQVDKVRKEEWRKLTDKDERRALKGMRWLLYKHSSNRSKKDTRTLNELRRANRRIHRAWILKDEFNQLWEYKSRTWAKKFLKKWCTTTMKSQLEPMKKFVGTVRRHEKEILNFVGTGVTNAIGEGINRVIQMLKNQASGFRDVNNFMDMIYLRVGDLDLPAQIPPRFRTA